MTLKTLFQMSLPYQSPDHMNDVRAATADDIGLTMNQVMTLYPVATIIYNPYLVLTNDMHEPLLM